MYKIQSYFPLYYHGDMPVYEYMEFETAEEAKEFLDNLDVPFDWDRRIFTLDDNFHTVYLDDDLQKYYYFPEGDVSIYGAESYEEACEMLEDNTYLDLDSLTSLGLEPVEDVYGPFCYKDFCFLDESYE
ncbi:hypothetical protein LNQ82_04555 [Conchiformibius steedae DSM 2580]|uniref:Uncharacterized protein n=1 Tax=Conchiformibius steedae DSM 2580 TaxID=1121352 RepID=A0AAE9KZ48_9NEIS|nr:hypothetical protein [Conchiformibius steedae]QMT33761.1 hypothetical protein H3L98_01635 [Conchiformibius steedae]URD68422.1 hypothetical protein LNQ82_04555 [Conchiformibius steedae DSM 2580]